MKTKLMDLVASDRVRELVINKPRHGRGWAVVYINHCLDKPFILNLKTMEVETCERSGSE